MPDVPTLNDAVSLLLVVVFLIAVVVASLWLVAPWLVALACAVEHRYEATRRALTDDPKAQR